MVDFQWPAMLVLGRVNVIRFPTNRPRGTLVGTPGRSPVHGQEETTVDLKVLKGHKDRVQTLER